MKIRTCDNCRHQRGGIPCRLYSAYCVNSKDKPYWEPREGFQFVASSSNITYDVKSETIGDAIAEVAILLENEPIEFVYEGVFTKLS